MPASSDSQLSTLRKTLVAVLLCSALSSCAARVFCPPDSPRLSSRGMSPHQHRSGTNPVARYVAGQKAADGFDLTSITAMEVRPVCGMGYMVTAATFGLVPSNTPYPLEITVAGQIHGRTQTRTYLLPLHLRSSVWHRLIPASSDDRQVARGLLGAMLSDRPLSKAD